MDVYDGTIYACCFNYEIGRWETRRLARLTTTPRLARLFSFVIFFFLHF